MVMIKASLIYCSLCCLSQNPRRTRHPEAVSRSLRRLPSCLPSHLLVSPSRQVCVCSISLVLFYWFYYIGPTGSIMLVPLFLFNSTGFIKLFFFSSFFLYFFFTGVDLVRRQKVEVLLSSHAWLLPLYAYIFVVTHPSFHFFSNVPENT